MLATSDKAYYKSKVCIFPCFANSYLVERLESRVRRIEEEIFQNGRYIEDTAER